MKPKTALWVFLFLLGTSCLIFSQTYIVTDAAGGIFQADQRLSFTLSSPGRLRLLLDDREIYQGNGPAFPEIGLPAGEERGFTLSAEYYSPDNKLLESSAWYIYIDKNPPAVPKPEFSNTDEGLRLVNSRGGKELKIRALADTEEALVFFPDLAESTETGLLPASSFYALVWAEDLAGNCSEPGYEYFEMPPVKIENPVSGEWLNRQILILSGAEGRDVYWTADGSDPLMAGGTGRLYKGPERIERNGHINLRIAWRDSAGQVREGNTNYSVAENSESSMPESLAAFAKAEEKSLAESTALTPPDGWRWSMGDTPRVQPEGNIIIRPEPFIKRTAVLQLSSPDSPLEAPAARPEKMYRFAYLLDRTELKPEEPSPPPDLTLEEEILYPSDIRLISAGRCRLIIWPQIFGTIYYSWGGSASEGQDYWQKGTAPLPVGLEGGELYWFIFDGEDGQEPDTGKAGFARISTVTIEPLTGAETGNQSGRIAFRRFDEKGNSGWSYVSTLLDYSPGIMNNRVPDVCDGEDLQWAFISSAGKILEQQRRDRLAPHAPEFTDLPEGGWTRGPVRVSAVSQEKDAACFISARISYASGAVEMLSGRDSLEIVSKLGEAAEVTVAGMVVDASGNRSPNAIHYFKVDPKTVYVSAEPLIRGSPKAARGGKDNPFKSLEEALEYAMARDLGEIQIAGTLKMRKPVTISRNVNIDGGRKEGKPGSGTSSDNGAILILHEDFSWNIKPGAGLTLSGLRLERKDGKKPLIRTGKDSRLEITDAVLSNTGPLVMMDGSECSIRDSWISVLIPGERRIPALTGLESGIQITNTRIQFEGNYSLIFDLKGGSLYAGNCVFLAAGARTASIFSLNGTRGNLSNLTLSAAARDYASVLEAKGSEFVISGGIMEVSARDTGAFLLDNSPAIFLDTELRLEGSFSAKAAEIHGPFPVIRNSGFFSTGASKMSAVFSGTNAVPVSAELLAGNRFTGFTHIWGRNP